MASLIDNTRIIFSDTFSNTSENTQEAESSFVDINNSLLLTINNYISVPPGNFSFLTQGFGSFWKNSYTLPGLPTEILISHADWLDIYIKPILADAIAEKINLLAGLMATAPPPVAIAATPVVAAVLSLMAGGAAIASALTTGVSSATAIPGGQTAIPGLVSTALVGMSALVRGARLVPETAADFASLLHFLLQNVGLPGALQTPAAAWSIVNPQILTIPVNPSLKGDLGPNFWRAILVTIQQAVPGVSSI